MLEEIILAASERGYAPVAPYWSDPSVPVLTRGEYCLGFLT